MLPKLFGKYGSAKSLGAARGMQALRGTGRGIRGVARLPGRVLGAAAGAVALSSGFAPVIAAASGLGRGLFGSRRGGRSRGRSRGGGSETGLLNTSVLFQIRDEVAQIKGLLVTQQIPESERREREFEDWRRHRELLSAISGLSGVGGGLLTTGKKDGGSLANLLMGLLAITGLAMLPKLLENIPSIIDGIQNFLDKMGLFLLGMWGAFKVLGKRARGMRPPPKTKAPRGGRKPVRKPGKSFIRRIFAKKTSPTGGPRGKTGRRGWFNTMRARGTSPTGGPRGKTDRRGWFRRMAAGGLRRSPSGRSTAASRPAARANPYRTWEGRPGGDRARTTRVTTAAIEDRARLKTSIAETETRLNTRIEIADRKADRALGRARATNRSVVNQNVRIGALEANVRANDAKTLARKATPYGRVAQGMEPSGPIRRPVSTSGQVRPGARISTTVAARALGWQPVSPSHSTRTPLVPPVKTVKATPFAPAGTRGNVGVSMRVPSLVVGTTQTSTGIKPVVISKKGNFTVAGFDGKPTTNVVPKSEVIRLTGAVRPSHAMDAGDMRGRRIQPSGFVSDAGSTRGQRIQPSGFVSDAGSTAGQRPVRGRPSVPATPPKVTGGGPSGRSPGATLYETPWQRFVRMINKNLRKLSRKGKALVTATIGKLKPAMVEGGKVMAEFNNKKMIRGLGMFALFIIAIIEFAELVALRIEDKISWADFAYYAGIKLGVIMGMIVMFASFMALITVILAAMAPFLGTLLIGSIAVVGSVVLLDWLTKALLGNGVPGEEFDPKAWLDRSTKLKRTGAAMASQNIFEDPMLVLAGGIIGATGYAVGGATHAIMAVNEFGKFLAARGTHDESGAPAILANKRMDRSDYIKFNRMFMGDDMLDWDPNTGTTRSQVKKATQKKSKGTPEQKVLGNRGLKGSLRKLRRTYKSWQSTAKDSTQRDFAHSNMEMIQAQIWAMLSMGSAEDQIFVVYNSQYTDASTNSQNLTKITSVNSNAGSNISIDGKGFYE